jgi:hypothetical protein
MSIRLKVYNEPKFAPKCVPGCGRYGGVVVKFKPLLDRWRKDAAPALTVNEYAVRLPLDDASRLHALTELFPGRSIEEITTDLLHAGLDEIAAAMPYEAGPKIISRDDHGDPVYEDVGLTPRFAEITRKYKKNLEAGVQVDAKAESAPKGAPAAKSRA